MFKIHSLLTLALMLSLSAILSAQVRYGIHVKGGYSNFVETDYDKIIDVVNVYTKLPSFNLCADVIIPFIKADSSAFQFVTGLDFGSFAAKNSLPDYFFDREDDPFNPPYTGPRSWNERFYSLSAPFKLNFKFEKWLYIYGGLAYTCHINKPDEIRDKKISRHTVSLIGGIDFLMLNRFILGASYYKNLTPSMKLLEKSLDSKSETAKIFWHVQQISVKIGYII